MFGRIGRVREIGIVVIDAGEISKINKGHTHTHTLVQCAGSWRTLTNYASGSDICASLYIYFIFEVSTKR